jgi:UDP-galactopyranose mutase
MRLGDYDVVVVGAGLYGLTIAEILARERELRSLVIDRREHIGGNAFSYTDADTGIEIHKYGTHVFHTSNEQIAEYVQRFCEWIPYEFTAWSISGGQVYSLPVNLHTISQLYGRALSPAEARDLIASETIGDPGTAESFEAKALATVGPRIYEAFFRGYTEKQWQTPASELPASVFSRLPVRFSFDDRYFGDTFQAMPRGGYGALMRGLISSDAIDVRLGIDWCDLKTEVPPELPVIYSGPLDEYFDYEFGRLPWRTLDYEIERLDVGDFQGAPMVNYGDRDIPFTRIHEYRHFPHGNSQRDDATIIAREFSRFAEPGDEPFYPINTAESRAVVGAYKEAARRSDRRVHFGGRLGSYKYLDMHMAIGAAMRHAKDKLLPFFRGDLSWEAASPNDD